MKEYVGIYIKTEKAQEQDGFGNKMKYHFHITTVHKYRFFVFAFTLAVYTYVGLLCGSGISFVAKAILFLCFFGFDIYPYILFHFFYYSCFDSIFK